MKTILLPVLCLAALAAGLLPAAAQGFTSGSDGSFGPINVTTADLTIDLPPDGVIHATTVNVASGRTLRFNRNALNTPVTLLATGNVTITGTINLDGARGSQTSGGRGGPGGFDGGSPGSAGTPPGDGHGPGAGRAGTNNQNADGAGAAAHATRPTAGSSTRHGEVYGSALLIPVLGGSGGGGTLGTPGYGGGGGGGGILIASGTRIDLAGQILARGAWVNGSAANSGSGGAIRLVAPVVAGSGQLNVRGSEGVTFASGDGRIRVDTQDRSQMALNFNPVATTAVGSLMLVNPVPLPRLDLVEVAGSAVPVGSGPVQVILPFGSPAAQTVKVRAQDFGGSVPARLVLTPESGSSLTYDFDINNAAANPAEATVNVEVPVNTRTSIAVWTR